MKTIQILITMLMLSSCTIYHISDEKITRYKKELELPALLDTVAVHNVGSLFFSYPLSEISKKEQFLLELFSEHREIERINNKIVKVEKKIKKIKDKENELKREIEKFEKEKLKKKIEIENKKNQFKISQK